jgi:hypothetical protein
MIVSWLLVVSGVFMFLVWVFAMSYGSNSSFGGVIVGILKVVWLITWLAFLPLLGISLSTLGILRMMNAYIK